MDKDKIKISELQKEVRELKAENQNLNWMLKKQFDWHSERIKKEIENENKLSNFRKLDSQWYKTGFKPAGYNEAKKLYTDLRKKIGFKY